MAATVARLQAVLAADTGQFDRAMAESDRRVQKSGSGLVKYGKVAALGLGAAGAAGAVAFLKKGWDEMAEAQKVSAQTEAVIKSTGKSANVTAGQVGDLAAAIMRKSGIDDEAVQSGENMLLTFTNIRNETGKGNDVFNQATSILADMSVAMGTDMSKQAIQLGKALNDPVKGISALSRVGVTFTADQKTMIKEMVASGDAMGAQKLILAELNKEFGGSAEALGKTLPGQINIAKETLNNFAGDVVAKAVPAIASVINLVREKWPQIRQVIQDVWLQVKPTLQSLIDIATLIKDTIVEHWGTISRNMEALKTVIVDALKIVRGAIELVNDLLHGRWSEAWTDAKQIVAALIDGIKTILTNALENIRQLAFALGRAALNGIKAGLEGLGQLFLDAVVTPLKEQMLGIIDWIRDHWKQMLVTLLLGLPGALWAALQTSWGKEFLDKIQSAFLGIYTWIKENVVDAIVNAFADIPDRIKDALTGLAGKATDAIGSVAGKLNPFGDPRDSTLGIPFSGNLMGALPAMSPFAALAAKYGLVISSGLRPGAITKHGTLSDHAVGKALDVVGSASAMAAFFRSLIGNPAVKQAFYDPLGSIFAGALSGYREGGHSDHVHVATYDHGGYLNPGWTLAYNGLGRPEPVGMGGNIIVNVAGSYVGERAIEDVVVDAIARARNKGRPI